MRSYGRGCSVSNSSGVAQSRHSGAGAVVEVIDVLEDRVRKLDPRSPPLPVERLASADQVGVGASAATR
jgi:hypothetical protein